MKKIKFAVIFAFAITFAGFELSRTVRVTGQTEVDLAAPTGVRATDNLYNNKVGIGWDTMRGATFYRIFRNAANNPATAIDMGTTPANTFFDVGVPAGQVNFYWVRAENATKTSDMSVADQGARTGTQQQGPVPPLGPPPVPIDNPVTATKAELGKALFWDEQMSSTKTVSCGTCHHSGNGGTDPRSVAATTISTNPGIDAVFGTPDDIRGSAGVPSSNADGTYVMIPSFALRDQVTGRKTVSYVNAGYAPLLFWDGRATGIFRDPLTNAIVVNGGGALESQAVGPPVSSAEMAHTGRDWIDVAARMASVKPMALSPTVPAPLNAWIGGRGYPELFEEAFGTPEVTPSRIALAIATFERTLYGDQAPLDLANAGITPLTQQEQIGRNIFNASSCNVCHAGNLLTDNTFRYIGVRPQNDDTGRFQVTGNNGDRGSFRVPSLRNVELRGSFFHNGQFTTLEQVVAFYNRGGDFNAPNKPNNLIRPLGLSPNAQADLVAFLKRPLTDPRVRAASAPFDQPGLYMGSSRVPQVTGLGRPGSGGATPLIKAISPPIVGNTNFTVSVSGALGNAPAVLVIDAVDPGVGTAIPVTGSFARVTANTQSTGPTNGWTSVSLPVPDSAALVGKTFFARWYVTDPVATNGFAVSEAARFTVFGEASPAAKAKYVDFDGDGRTDISVFRPSDGNWYVLKSSDNSFSTQHFGIATDRIAPADYDGDQKTDVAVYRDGTWYLSRSRDGLAIVQFGLAGDLVQPGDYDGDGIEDVAVYRPSTGTWYMQQSRDGFVVVPFGAAGDRPVAADFDGDGRTDQAVYRDGTWYVNKSSGGVAVMPFGVAEDKPVVGDYDGDGKADIAVWRPSTGVWYRIKSSDGSILSNGFGLASDTASPGDYDGDGANDLAVYRAGTWFIQNSTSGQRIMPFGLSDDRPVPSAIIP